MRSKHSLIQCCEQESNHRSFLSKNDVVYITYVYYLYQALGAIQFVRGDSFDLFNGKLTLISMQSNENIVTIAFFS